MKLYKNIWIYMLCTEQVIKNVLQTFLGVCNSMKSQLKDDFSRRPWRQQLPWQQYTDRVSPSVWGARQQLLDGMSTSLAGCMNSCIISGIMHINYFLLYISFSFNTVKNSLSPWGPSKFSFMLTCLFIMREINWGEPVS